MYICVKKMSDLEGNIKKISSRKKWQLSKCVTSSPISMTLKYIVKAIALNNFFLYILVSQIFARTFVFLQLYHQSIVRGIKFILIFVIVRDFLKFLKCATVLNDSRLLPRFFGVPRLPGRCMGRRCYSSFAPAER
jgi:hypothetical protein